MQSCISMEQLEVKFDIYVKLLYVSLHIYLFIYFLKCWKVPSFLSVVTLDKC